MAIKGLDRLHYAVINEENDQKTEYSEVKSLGPAMALNMQPSINRANLRADDKVLFSDSEKGPIAVTLNTAYLDEEVESEILGKTIHENGTMSDNVADTAPYIAIGGRAADARGGYQYFWLYRVRLAPAQEDKQTKQETPEYQTPNLEGEAIPRLHDGEEKTKVWDGSENIDSDMINDWFNEVIDKNYPAGNGGAEG